MRNNRRYDELSAISYQLSANSEGTLATDPSSKEECLKLSLFQVCPNYEPVSDRRLIADG
jgi:hypothetical protein